MAGFDKKGEVAVFAEVKFEGFSIKAKNTTLKEYRVAKKLKAPYYLTIPKNPIYSNEVTNSWLKKNLPSDLRIYKFVIPKGNVLPKQEAIQFTEIKL